MIRPFAAVCLVLALLIGLMLLLLVGGTVVLLLEALGAVAEILAAGPPGSITP